MTDDFLVGEIDMRKTALIDALQYHKKLFSANLNLDSKFTDLRLDFDKVNDKAQEFIKVALQYITESENNKLK